jgi:hypothetical protein
MRGNFTFAGIFIAMSVAAAPAVTIGHVDTFEDGSTMGWVTGMMLDFTPLNIPDGGPAGAGDSYLQLNSTGDAGQPGGRLVVNNATVNWTGNFGGISAIRMDLNNFGPTDLDLRLLFEDFAGLPPPVNLALSTEPVSLQAGSGWVTVTFPIHPGALTAPFGTAAAALANTDVVRIFHNPSPEFLGPMSSIPAVEATLGIDNITAVPEPGFLALFAAGAAALALLRRKSKSLGSAENE